MENKTNRSKKKIIVFLYNSFKDPVIQSNIYLYLKEAGKSSKYEFALISFEQEAFKLSGEARLQQKKELEDISIHWYDQDFSTGNLIFKIYDFIKVFSLVFYLRFFKGYKRIISLNSVAGSIAFIMSRLFGLRIYLYQHEPHSEYGRDAGLWSEQSLSYKVLNRLEYISGNHANIVSSGTFHMENRLIERNSKAKFYKIPSVANDTKFTFSAEKRNLKRKELNISEETKVIIYPGKFGDLYFKEELGVLFSTLSRMDDSLFFLIITMNPKQEIYDLMLSKGLSPDRFLITTSTYQEMDTFLSTADLGVVSVPPLPSKKFCSNIKVGEYLCCGLPYIICRGVSEDDSFAEKNNVGIVLDDFSEDDVEKHYPLIRKYLEEDKQDLRRRCRDAALRYRAFSSLNPIFQDAIQTL